jgi:hypothetical protein
MDTNSNWPRTIHSKTLTFAMVDGPDDIWSWSIVDGYKGPQDYGTIRASFSNDPPSEEDIRKILAALEAP